MASDREQPRREDVSHAPGRRAWRGLRVAAIVLTIGVAAIGASFRSATSAASFRSAAPAASLRSAAPAASLRSAAPAAGIAQRAPSFATLVADLSEPGGHFDTDNLISNERSYLQVVTALRRDGVTGGAYVGVGPDTNFSYIAETRPAIAFVIDIRRDNLLLHLLFKALFECATTRAEYLALLLGRETPLPAGTWREASIERLVTHFARPAAAAAALASQRRRIEGALASTGVALSRDDLATIHRFHERFIDDGLALRFNSAGRAPQQHYPTYRDLLVETDASDRHANYLASEGAFQFVRSLQRRDLVIPVVGDLSGPSALSAIGRTLAARREALSVLYTSNVEFYLYSQGAFERFVANLRRLPRNDRSTVIRSVFGRFTAAGRPGDGSTSQLQKVGDLLGGLDHGRFRSYGQLVAGR